MNSKYNLYKVFNYPEKLKAIKEGQVLAPKHVRLKPINACNHDCWYCCYRVDNLQLGESMDVKDQISLQKMNEIISDLSQMGVEAITFSGGGEPLIYPHIKQALKQISKCGIKIGLLTNGSRLCGETAKVVAENCTWVRVSMDSWDTLSHEDSRRVKGEDYEKIIQNLKNFSSFNSSCDLGVSFIISNKNYREIYNFCDQMKSCGVKHIKLSACVVSNNVAENNDYHQKIISIVEKEISDAKKLENDNFKLINHYHLMPKNFIKQYNKCSSLSFLTVIGADLKVYTCQDKAYTSSGLLGTIENCSFKEFWYSKENQNRIFTLNPSLECLHHCVSHEKNIVINNYLDIDENHSSFV